MLLAAISWAAVTLPDAGRVEVEGLVITAVARHFRYRPSRKGGVVYLLEFSVTPTSGGAPKCQFVGPIRALGADGKPLSTSSRVADNDAPRFLDWDRCLVELDFDEAPPKTLPAVDGVISIAPTQWATATFEGAALKPNAVVAMGQGRAKLTVFDLDDGGPDVQFRVALPRRSDEPPIFFRAKLIDVRGNESKLVFRSSQGHLEEHRISFKGDKAAPAASVRTLRLEMPTAIEKAKKLRFRIPDVPVMEWGGPRKGGR